MDSMNSLFIDLVTELSHLHQSSLIIRFNWETAD